jgi:hypothetical protein
MRIDRSAATAERMFKTLLSMMRECKKCLENENKMFAKLGIASLTKGQAKVMPMLDEFHEYYIDALGTRDLKNTVSEDVLNVAATEYDELQKILKKYYINLEIAGRVSNMFLDTIKKSIQIDAKKDYGYNKDGMLVSDKKILSTMQPISVNNKV